MVMKPQVLNLSDTAFALMLGLGPDGRHPGWPNIAASSWHPC